ncbi:unnamed protein product [Ixodes pacificus]
MRGCLWIVVLRLSVVLDSGWIGGRKIAPQCRLNLLLRRSRLHSRRSHASHSSRSPRPRHRRDSAEEGNVGCGFPPLSVAFPVATVCLYVMIVLWSLASLRWPIQPQCYHPVC